jgi:4-hydroxyphenylpyruvate dioxygenase
MGFKNILTFDDKQISTEYSALMSKVMSNGNGFVKFPINEPAEGKKKSQVEEYLDFYKDAGVQHIAIATDNIVETVEKLSSRGVEFLNIPSTYYDDLLDRIGPIDEDIAPLKKLGILVDRDEEGYLPSLWKIDQPCFLKLYKGRALNPLEQVISKPYLKLWKESKI